MVGSQAIDLERFYAGEQETLAAIYREHGLAVERAVSCHCRGALAECVVHEVFVTLVEREAVRRQFLGGDLGAWLATIARHRAIDALRRERRLSLCDDPRSLEGKLPAVEEEESLLDRDQARRLEEVLRRFEARVLPGLSAPLRQVYQLRFEERRSQAEASRLTGIPRATLIEREQKLMQRLSRFLRAEFAPDREARR